MKLRPWRMGVAWLCLVGTLLSTHSSLAAESECRTCHSNPELTDSNSHPVFVNADEYTRSVHGVAGLDCTSCHPPSATPEPAQHPKDLTTIDCGACHEQEKEAYSRSVHWTALASGVKEAPSCVDCHGEHTIERPSDPTSTVSSLNVARTCSHCHENERLAEKYNLPAKRYATYLDSYHGVANKFGDVTVANCGSCHGAHEILPSSDPRSTINAKNLPRTCGKCHPNAGENFSKSKIHVEAKKEVSLGAYVVRQFYTWFIGTLTVCFLVYAGLDFRGKLRQRALETGEKQRKNI